MMIFPGYHLGENLYQGTRTLVYRGTRTTDSQPVVIKFLRNEYPTFSELVQFRNQYSISKNLDLPGIVKPLALETHGKGYALVMPDEGYISLDQWRQGKFSLTNFLAIAVQLAEILQRLYQNRVIHKDIKPANILIHPDTKQVKLIDFSIASLLPKETQEISNPNILEGTLAYISPEQTGRMNRAIDYRSDFYSLGVTFYELLTGKLPFNSDDPMELVHCHIAKTAPPLETRRQRDRERGREEIPRVISDLVIKLMAKNAEDRYQSALGLKYDLEKCLSQWKETGKIEPFELGERDICDHFMIPEKLYGRETKVEILLAAFERVAAGNSEIMLVAGFSGIGKTAVVNEVHKPIVRQRGYFIKGKFDQFNRNIPFSAFVQAFRDLMGQLLSESDVQLQQWKSKILSALGENAQVIIEVMPELEGIVGKQPPVSELSGSAAQNRFNLLFQKLIAVFTTPEHPLVMFLDDLQWADLASLNLMKVLMGDRDTGYLLLLGAYRDNEVFPAHPLMLQLNELEKRCKPADGTSASEGAPRENQTVISTVTLHPLAVDHITQLVAETLSCSPEIAQPLTELVYQKTQGNPFFATQFLKGLHELGLITFNLKLGYWECDLVQVREAALTDDVVELIAGRLHQLSDATQEVLKLAACIGNPFDLETLAIVSEQSSEDAAASLWGALQEGLVLPISETYKFFQGVENEVEQPQTISVGYRFLHDRIQQAAYFLISEEQKQITHLKIGQLLLNNTSNENIEDKIFDIVNQINLGSELITQPSEQRQLAQLNFRAGKKAKTATAYTSAFEYSEMARCLLPEHHWQQDYEFALPLYELAAETAYLTGNFTTAETLTDILFDNAIDVWGKVKACEVRIQVLLSQNQLLEAIHVALKFLSTLGIDLPENPDEIDVERALSEMTAKLSGDRIESLISLPLARDKKQLASMRILSGILNAAYLGLPNLLPIIVAKQVDLSITYGNMDVSPSAYANYGLILCGIVDDIESGYHFGNLALNLLNTIESQEFSAKTIEIVCLSVKHWKEHISATLELLLKAYKIALETGDFESASFAAHDYCSHSFVLGRNLIDLERQMFNYSVAIGELKQRMLFNLNELHRQAILNLINKNDNPSCLKGKAYDEEKMLPIHQQDNDFSSLALFYIDKLFLCYLFGDSRQATEMGNQVESYLEGIPGQVFVPIFYFYDALSWLSLYDHLDQREQEGAMQRILSHQTRMAKWADSAAMNYAHKLDLIKAEKHRVLGEKMEAMEMYDLAINGAKTNEYIQEEALANELAAQFYLDWGKEKFAACYMQEAYYCYARWGAKVKTEQLEEKYPQLLIPILQQQYIELNGLDHLESFTQTLTIVEQTLTKSSSISTSNALDFAYILQTAQTLSSTIELNQLLAEISRMILTNAGAQKAVLLIPQAGEWQLRATAKLIGDGTVETNTQSQPLTLDSPVPTRLVQYVKNTLEPILIDEAKTDISGILEGYLLKYQPQSILCVPLLNQGQLVAILYLEHPTTKGVFTPYRQRIVNFFCTQAAISLQNAQLYEQAQQALRDLKQAQLQIVQSEKMSALGNLVSGVAHEINNPTGFLQGNIQPAQDYVQDLLDFIDILLEKCPNNDSQIQDEMAEIDLEFIREDLPKLLGSMNLGVERIRNISNSLRTFSRKDQYQKNAFNIHQGIDSTLLILKHRTKSNEQRPAIQITKNYEDIPEVQCFPGQLNQVFMNILANAIDAFEEANHGKTYAEIKANPNLITIGISRLDENQVQIQIQDNGCGMKPETQAQIFEQGFTTKDVGKGTGLGMAIAHQIITEKHNGTITCDSTFGQGTIFTITLPIV